MMRQRPHEHLEGGRVSHCTQHFIIGLQSEKARYKAESRSCSVRTQSQGVQRDEGLG